jgi:hypothetical protein
VTEFDEHGYKPWGTTQGALTSSVTVSFSQLLTPYPKLILLSHLFILVQKLEDKHC